jgi:hypothetical protein
MSTLANSVQPFSLILVFRITVIRYLNHVVENPKLSIQQWHPLGLEITRLWVYINPKPFTKFDSTLQCLGPVNYHIARFLVTTFLG